ncbi:unnamed protein product [Ectocarpus sp. CCAP 1310/34]|nr:unnamed protein product [Ectocarpus sp. CCAP 1310/34]
MQIHIAPVQSTAQRKRGRSRSVGVRFPTKASFDTSIQMNARGRGMQITRSDCFTQACRAVWPGDEPVPAAISDAVLS